MLTCTLTLYEEKLLLLYQLAKVQQDVCSAFIKNVFKALMSHAGENTSFTHYIIWSEYFGMDVRM